MKQNKTILIILVIFSMFIQTSCEDYLGIEPKGVRLLSTVNDYELWLESDFLQTQVPFNLNYLSDTKDITSVTSEPSYGVQSLYTWQEQILEDPKASPLLWADLYKAIYYYNTVIMGIEDATGGTSQQKKSIEAEALMGRAFTYLQLVNLYGKQYNDATSATDLAVPFVISNDLNEPTPDRSSVKEIYDYIITDLNEAIPNLPDNNNDNKFRGSVAGAYSILARTYLFMGKYQDADRYAKLALENGPNEIVDYANIPNASVIPDLKYRPDAIFARYNSGIGVPEFPTLELLKSYNTKDKRLNLYFSNVPFFPMLAGYIFPSRGVTMYWPGGITMTGKYVYPNCGTSVVEMRLIMAEAAARTNNLVVACDELDEVRKHRFPSSSYVKFESADQEEVLNEIIKDRMHEFPFHGMRWFDMRRLDAENRMPAVNRYDEEGNIIATLSPGSSKYTLQIPSQVLQFNQDWPVTQ
ncbi:RagB/SusD family nutrient uptake outer membrane protein [Lutibacter sp. A80]|uniref:RagB/SusD family nutrient uptake outer membrane protein n=1 Tax=Lutibacter sp. A80 TaxID=2918453 RepID=UPI001F06CB82|nr:RagB/SusD family nutrient uptake outer membrane protein [Lutibacter sp. A80]UMB59567.1 RagB/SusD family nutrient uptake outer membrane protein [Lutibacter sp. A80]